MADRYRAFISYCHADEKWAAWLQRTLERYRVPKRLRLEQPGLPRRLNPIFRDKEELASASDLGDSIRSALARSDALIVVCSPAAAASRWVNEEIRVFRELAPDRDIFCLMVAGSPERDTADCAFPVALLKDENGSELPEPLAADARPGSDGKQGALIKIAAGLLGVGIDALRQRDQQRRVRFFAGLATGAAAISVVTIGLAVSASLARNEAELRRDQAEDLIEFMLVELRERLQLIGKLDALDVVGDQAMEYFAALGDDLSPDDALSRVMALRQIGEVRFDQGRLEAALEAFNASRDHARTLHSKQPGDNDLLFELGQAEFWVGYVAWERQQFDVAANAFEIYMDHSEELLSREPGNPDYLAELMYAFSNLGSLALEQGRRVDALAYFEASNEIARRIARENPNDAYGWVELREGLSWRGSTLIALGDLEGARESFVESLEAADKARRLDASMNQQFEWAQQVMQLAGMHRLLGETDRAQRKYEEALTVFSEVVAHDPDNAVWRRELARTHLRLAELDLLQNDQASAARHVGASVSIARTLTEKDPTNLTYRVDYAVVLRVDAERLLSSGDTVSAMQRALAGHELVDAILQNSSAMAVRMESARAEEILGRLAAIEGDSQAAMDRWERALTRLPGDNADLLETALRARLLHRLGRYDTASPLVQVLTEAGFADPMLSLPEKI
ncbi:MAG: TIR domain-containing protein [Gammaproteobacteria bacterium]|nr:TIR domain-containing protein [Gammaproteobacteria bacterium]